MDVGLLIARFLLGLAVSTHGSQKLFGWFGGHGLKGTGAYFESIGFRPGVPFALAAGLGEAGGGLLIAAGLGGPIGPALIALVMLVAMMTVHAPHGFFAESDGIELPLAYLTAASVFAFSGFGAYSMDRLLGFETPFSAATVWITIGIAVVIAFLNVALRGRVVVPHSHA
jgi:putative oxidoreductase